MIARAVAWARSMWRGLRRRPDVEAEALEEFRLHIEMRAEDLARGGLDPAEALRQARLEFGSIERYREEGRGARGLRALDELRFSLLDVRLGVRMMVKHPGLTAVGVLALAFAIFVGAAGFEITKRAVFPRISLADPDRVVTIDIRDPASGRPTNPSVDDFVRWRGEVESIEPLGAFRLAHRNLIARDGRGEPVMLVEMTPSAFGLTGVRPLLGRALVESDERPEAPAVIVIGYDVWRNMGFDPTVVGSSVQIAGEKRTVVGVMPEETSFPEHWFDAWVPLRITAESGRQGSGVRVFGRLAPGATIDQAQAELTVVGRRSGTDVRTEVRRLQRVVWRNEGQPAALLSVNVALAMLLILVCSNVALLVFARAATREGEIALRTALGAGRRRIMMQLVAESLVLAAVAAAIGLCAAELVLRWNFGFPRIGFMDRTGLSAKTLLYAGLLGCAAAGILGVIPALKVTRGLAGRLRRVGAGGGGFRFGGLWTAVVIAQVAFTVAFPMFPIGSRAEIDAWRRLSTEAGIPTREYLIFLLEMDNPVEPGLADIPRDSARAATYRVRFDAAYRELERRLEADGRVRSVTFANQMPTRPHRVRRISLDQPGAASASAPQPDLRVSTASVGLDFFDAMDAPVVTGRGFDSGDLESGAPVVVVNRSFVDRVLGGRNAVGRRVRYVSEGGRSESAEEPWYEIVGVVPDRGTGRSDQPWAAGVYHAVAPATVYPPLVAVRVTGEPATMAPPIQAVAASVDPSLRVDDAERIPGLSVVSLYEANYWTLRGPALLFSLGTLLSTVAVLLSLAGIYAITSFTVWQRTREIGLRVALGAGWPRIVTAIFRRPLAQVGLGALIGAVLVALVVATDDAPLSASQAAVFALQVVVVTGVCLLASVLPMLRAVRIEPSRALAGD